MNRPRAQRRKCHPLNQSPFYKLTSPRRLAGVLQIHIDELEALLAANNNYKIFEIDRGGKKRIVEEPKSKLQSLHKRINNLLARIEAPEYLHSAIKGRSYLSNAKAHLGHGSMVKVDVRSFFRSVPRVAVFDFFKHHMKCDEEVAGMSARLLTIDGHLPTGSSASPIVSYYAYKDMFDSIHNLAVKHGLRMTCYVDDMCLSGHGATRRLLHEVRRIIASYGLKSHKAHFFSVNRPKVVTGVVLTVGGLRLPNQRHKKINDEYLTYTAAASPVEKLAILQRLISRVCEAAQIDTAWQPKATALIAERRKLELQALRPAKTR